MLHCLLQASAFRMQRFERPSTPSPFAPTLGTLPLLRRSPLYCIDFQVKPLEQPEGEDRYDTDRSWQTNPTETIVPVRRDKFSVRPSLITFDAFNTLIAPSQSIGRWYREALNEACDMRMRLPRPSLFDDAFNIAYKDMTTQHPCFGALSGMTARAWWGEVIHNTYKGTKFLTEIEPDELKALMPEVVDNLYDNVFGTKVGWIIKEDVEYTLRKLKEWRDIGNGPKIGLVSNFDDRLNNIMKELELLQYFDVVLTSHESKTEKPSKEIFLLAAQAAGCSDPSTCYHVGNSIDSDVEGATAAGWTPIRYNEWFDDDFPDWYAIETVEEADSGADSRRALLEWGRKSLDRNKENGGLEWMEIWGLDDVLVLFGFPDDNEKPIKTTYLRGVLQDDAHTT